MEKFCNITKKSHHVYKYKYLLSASLFYLKNSYKSAQRYVNGILKIVEFINYHDDYCLRLYYDQSVYLYDKYSTLMTYLRTVKKIELYEFSCPRFKCSGKFHIGTFGSMIRFLPLFEKSKDESWELVYIIDTDDSNYCYIDMYVKSLMNSKKNFYFYDFENYKYKYLGKLNNKFDNVVIANIFVKNHLFDIKILVDYLELISKTDGIYHMLNEINNESAIIKKSNSSVVRTYGLDEYFLNKYLIEIINEKQIGWITESLYFDYFFENLIDASQCERDQTIRYVAKGYLIMVLRLLDVGTTPDYSKMSIGELINLLIHIVRFHETVNDDKLLCALRESFSKNYYEFGEKYKKLTKEFYQNFCFVFDESFIDDFLTNDFNVASWYMKKHWNSFPNSVLNGVNIGVCTKNCV